MTSRRDNSRKGGCFEISLACGTVGDPDIFKFNSTVSEAYPRILGEQRMCDVVTLTRVAPPDSRACHETIKLI